MNADKFAELLEAAHGRLQAALPPEQTRLLTETFDALRGGLKELRAQPDAALKASEDRYRRIVEMAEEGIWSIDAETRTTYVNPRMAEMLGYSVEELLGRSAFDFVTPVDECKAECQWEMRQRGLGDRCEFRCRRKDGSQLWLTCSLTSLLDQDGQFAGAFGMFTDITERKQAEEAQARFVAILEATTDFVGMADRQMRPLYLNHAGRRMCGVGAEEDISESSIFDCYPEWVQTILREAGIPTALRDGAWSGETALLVGDGREIPVSQVILAHQDAGGAVAFFSTIARDITERKRMEEALRRAHDELEMRVQERTAELRESQERYRLLIDSLPIAVYTCDRDGRITLFNEQAVALWGRRPVIGEDLWCGSWRIFRPDGSPLPLDQCPMAVALRAGRRVLDQEIVIERPDGARAWVLPFPQPLHGPDGAVVGAVNVLMDVTPLKHAEQALRRAHDELEMRVQERTAELRESQERFALVFRASPVAISISTLDEGRFIDVNDAFLGQFGYRRDEVIGANSTELGMWKLEDRGEFVRRLRQQRSLRDVEIACQTRSGERRMMFGYGELIQLAGEECVLVLAHDITERKQAEERLRESEERFTAFMDNSPALAFMKDAEGRYVYANRPCKRALEKEMIGKTDFDLWPAETAKQLRENDRAALSAGEAVERIEVAPGRDGFPRQWLTLKFPVEDVSGRRFVGGVAVDITERRRAEHLARGQTAALARTLNTLTERPELDTFLGQLLAAIAEQLNALCTVLWFYDAEQDALVLHMTSDGGRAPADRPYVLRELPVWRELIRTRRPLLIEDIRTDARIPIRDRLLAKGIRTLLLVPLFLGDEAIGLLNIASTEPRIYQPEELELARALGQQATLAVQLTRLAKHEQQSAVLGERNRMAREIHDTLAQGFTGIIVQLEAAEYALTKRPEEARTCISRAHGLARESLAEARRSVRALRPQALERDELPQALETHAEKMTVGTPTRAQVHVHGTPRPLPAEAENDLLRIGLEALTNAIKHAGARTVRIDLGFEPDAVRLSVQDDGRGFDPTLPATADGFGLTGMRERAERLGGRLTITSRPGAGTEVIVTAPAVRESRLS